MIHVTFYILADQQPDALWLHACRLLAAEYPEYGQTFIECGTTAEAEHINQLLWSFEACSFIPHALIGQNTPAPIQIGLVSEQPSQIDTWFNLAHRDHQPTEQPRQIIEIVPAQPLAKEAARTRFRQYRQLGYHLSTQNL